MSLLAELVRTEPELRAVGAHAYETWDELSDATRLCGFLSANAPWLRVVQADNALLTALGGVPKIPSVFLFDRRGRLVHDWRRNQRCPPELAELQLVVRKLGDGERSAE